ncbi:MAG: LuxR family transcriptional regulator [Sphingomonadales bacterium]|nr:LuxR family transcriptional regulator [Sphingomonadales bacterium]
MQFKGNIFLVDGAVQRRAEISRRLLACGVHVEPYEDVREFLAHWPESGVILAHDSDGVIAEIVRHMGEAGTWLPVVGFAVAPETRAVVRAVQAGAIDYLTWPADEAAMLAAFAEAENASVRQTPARYRETSARTRISLLSRREREVLAAVAEGLSNRMIGERLSISPRTVEIHRSNMMTKMGATHVSEAIRAAFDAALV